MSQAILLCAHVSGSTMSLLLYSVYLFLYRDLGITITHDLSSSMHITDIV